MNGHEVMMRPREVVQDPCGNLVPWDDLAGCPVAIDGEIVVLARSAGRRMRHSPREGVAASATDPSD